MISAISYNLTQYTDFRKLQFEFSKLTDQNLQLKSRMATIEKMYRQQIDNFEKQKLNWHKTQASIKATLQESQEKMQELLIFSQNIHNQIINFGRMGIDFGTEFEQDSEIGKIDRIQHTKWIFNQIIKCMMITLGKNNDLALKYEKQVTYFKNEGRQSKQRESQLKVQIQYLSEEISKFENVNIGLMNEINVLKRQNMDYKLQFYQINKHSQEQSVIQKQKQDHIQDNNFALDLLNYEKELLQRIFAKILSSLQNQAVNQVLTDVYASYQAVAQAYRQKLQIQYDLQDLEREYKRQKNSRVSENLLIQLRKQIQQFRNELHKQKDLLNKQQENLERHFISLEAADRQEKKIRNYTFQIEKKLKDIKSFNDTKRNSDDNSVEPKSSRIQFKATTKTEDVMKQMVRKDRENIEKIFKQTRSNYIKNPKM